MSLVSDHCERMLPTYVCTKLEMSTSIDIKNTCLIMFECMLLVNKYGF